MVTNEKEAIELAKAFSRSMPQRAGEKPRSCDAKPARAPSKPIAELIPDEPNRGYDMRKLIDAIIDEGSWLEIKKLFAKELLTGFARLDGQAVGILANQPMQKGGVLFNDSADKAARFIWLCDAFEIPLLFLADVPGFMIGTDVEKRGIIRHGAKMISAVSEATVPKISVIVRKAYGAGLYAMAGPAFDSDAVIALPSAQIAVMGPEPAINAVFYNKLAELLLRTVAERQRPRDRPRLPAQLAGRRAQRALTERKRIRGRGCGNRSDRNAPGLGEVRGQDGKRPPRKGEPEVAVKPPAQQLEVVGEHEQHPGGDEGQQPDPEHRHTCQTESHRAHQSDDGGGP